MAAAPAPPTIASEKARRRRRRATTAGRAVKAALHGAPVSVRSQSLLDVVDSLIDKGLALDAEVVLGLADVDLLHLRVGALLAAADRVFPTTRRRRRATPAMSAAPRVGPAKAGHYESGARPAYPRDDESGLVSGRGRRRDPAPATTDETSRSVIRLVLTLVEFIRQLLERQAVRRVREKTLTHDEIERLGRALMLLEQTVHELAQRHGSILPT